MSTQMLSWLPRDWRHHYLLADTHQISMPFICTIGTRRSYHSTNPWGHCHSTPSTISCSYPHSHMATANAAKLEPEVTNWRLCAVRGGWEVDGSTCIPGGTLYEVSGFSSFLVSGILFKYVLLWYYTIGVLFLSFIKVHLAIIPRYDWRSNVPKLPWIREATQSTPCQSSK